MRCHMGFSGLFSTSHYWINIIFNLVFGIGINIGFDYYNFEAHTLAKPYSMWGELLFVSNMIGFMSMLPFILVLCTPCLRIDIKKKKTLPVHPDAFEFPNSPVRRLLFFAWREKNIWLRAIKFTLQSWIHPGIPVFIIISFFCWCEGDFATLKWNKSCSTNKMWTWIAWDLTWKLPCVIYMWSQNYAMSHNAGHEALLKWDDDERANGTADEEEALNKVPAGGAKAASYVDVEPSNQNNGSNGKGKQVPF